MSKNYPVRISDEVIDGAYIFKLGAEVSRSADGATYETEFGDRHLPAIIRIRTTDAREAEARWEKARQLNHPNLLRIYAAGRSRLDDVNVAYVVMERADETLAGAMAGRTLTGDEARELLIPTVAALRYLHRNGYVHSNLKASNILAVQDVAKLSSDDIRPAEHGATPADDMRALGGLLVQVTGRWPEQGQGADPIADIVRHCVDTDPGTRWTADQVQARLDGLPSVARLVEVPRTAEPKTLHDHRTRRFPVWLYAGLLVLALLAVALFSLVHRSDPQDSNPPQTAAPAVVLPLPEPVAPPAASSSTPNPRPTPRSGTGDKRGAGWSVIVAAYTFREPAEARRKELAQRWPAFHWNVMEQHAGKTYYLVVIGDHLSEDAANALRAQAVSSGLPRDTYIKRLP